MLLLTTAFLVSFAGKGVTIIWRTCSMRVY